MDSNTKWIHIEIKEDGLLENILPSLSTSSINGLEISGPLNDDDIVFLGKYLRSHSCINILDLGRATKLTSIDHNAFEHCLHLAYISLPLCINRIGDHAFDQCKALKELRLPDSIKSLGDRAFSGCENMASIYIPKNVSYIGVGAFYGCYKLTDIEVDHANPRYENRGGVLFDNVDKTLLRYIQTKQTECVFSTPEGVIHIGNYAFDGCKGLVSVLVNEGCTDLGERSFTRCNDLRTITLSSTINNLTYSAFDDCDTLEEIVVSKQNKTYSSKKGVLYTKDMKNLVICPKSKKSPFFFPSNIERICNGAFSGCKNLRTVILPKKISCIGSKAFSDCENLEFVNMPNSLNKIDDFAFANCKKLNRIKIYNSNPPTCGVNPFSSVNTGKCQLYVPVDAEMHYRNRYGWESFNNIEESIEQTIGENFPFIRNLQLKLKRIILKNFSKNINC